MVGAALSKLDCTGYNNLQDNERPDRESDCAKIIPIYLGAETRFLRVVWRVPDRHHDLPCDSSVCCKAHRGKVCSGNLLLGGASSQDF